MGVTPSNSHILLRITPHRFLFKSLPPLFLKSSCNNGIFFPFPIITNSLSFLRPVTNSCKTSVLIFLIMKIERLYYLYLSSSSNALNVEKLNALILANIFPVIYFTNTSVTIISGHQEVKLFFSEEILCLTFLTKSLISEYVWTRKIT